MAANADPTGLADGTYALGDTGPPVSLARSDSNYAARPVTTPGLPVTSSGALVGPAIARARPPAMATGDVSRPSSADLPAAQIGSGLAAQDDPTDRRLAG